MEWPSSTEGDRRAYFSRTERMAARVCDRLRHQAWHTVVMMMNVEKLCVCK